MLSDEKTVVGVQYEHEKELVVMEDIENDDPEYKPAVFRGNTNTVNTIVVHEELNTILAGDDDGNVIQFDLGTRTVVKDFGYLGIGGVLSSARIGHLAFFGGYDDVAVIDIKKTAPFDVPLETALGCVYSLQICVVDGKQSNPRPKVLLTVSGKDPDYSGESSDVFEASGLVEWFGEEIPARLDPFFLPLLSQVDKKQIEKLAEELRMKSEEQFELKRKLTNQNSELISKLKVRQRNISDLELELSKVQRTHIEELQQKEKEISDLNEALHVQNNQLKKQLEFKQTRVAELQNKVVQLEEAMQEMQTNFEDELTKRTKEMTECEESFNLIKLQLEEQLEQKDRQVQDFSERFAHETRDQSDLVLRLEEENRRLRTQMLQLAMLVDSHKKKGLDAMVDHLKVLSVLATDNMERYWLSEKGRRCSLLS